ncbi:antA/AntB antirepressor family protein [Duganella sp. HH101]|uniref:antA/AntB antirepressor family protein n=1 Tax=Duganella sp. HH101 TaxID=1781066 RepID=UPI0008936CC0|nr:antA/AntB antirepressor family protein [Duganella sp. HH101]OFA04822.1 AntA/AntB antirepressor [Duganella sp. HH101]
MTVLTTVQDIGIQSGAVVDGATIQTINARSLHSFLQSGKDFSNWIKDRVAKYGFVDGKDYTTFSPKQANTLGGRPSIDYHISLDMAKELAMVERTDKGREARQYFIECEKKLLHPSAVTNLNGLVRPVAPRYDDTR